MYLPYLRFHDSNWTKCENNIEIEHIFRETFATICSGLDAAAMKYCVDLVTVEIYPELFFFAHYRKLEF